MNLDDQMRILVGKIDERLSSNPNSNSMGVVEGELKDLESLLYTLKGKGVISLFEDVVLETESKRGSLEDRVYFFDVDRERFEKFKTENSHRLIQTSESASRAGVYYDPNAGIGWANGKRFKFKDQKRNYNLFKRLYEQTGKSVRKEEIWEIVGHKGNALFLNEVVGDLREKTGLSPDELVLNDGNITLAIKKLEEPPVRP